MALDRSPEFQLEPKTQYSRAFWYLRPQLEQTQKNSTMQSSLPDSKNLSQVVLKKKIFSYCLCIFISGRNRLNFHDRSSEGVSDQ